jgi:adenine specific DNA methylase Mod
MKKARIDNSEIRFYEVLKNIFIGAKVEGISGYINLMKIKSKYFEKIFEILQKEIEEEVREFPEFKEELYEKLYSFFKRYFSESGSIYFVNTPYSERIYERVYTDKKDVSLFWKTHMLYYVKSDRIYNSMSIEVGGFKFFFDVSKLEHKKAWEKKELIYEFKEVKNDGTIAFYVLYSERGRITKIDEIQKKLREKGIVVDEEILREAFSLFEKQSEVDYFINKNARKFLKEQFDLWLYQYVYSDESQFTEKRIKQLKVLKDIAYKIIDFISQFEDELVKIWNKPKFVLNSNYVITLDRIAKKENGLKIIEKIIKHKNFDEQIKEWKELEIVDENFNKNEILEGNTLNPKYQFLPIDTKYFKDLEPEIIGLFDNLDEELDGWLIKSENYQALITILPKFKGKVQTIYIDPPFNKEQDADYFYKVKFKDSTWITMLENRLRLARDLLKDTGSIFVNSDDNGNMFVRLILDEIFGNENFKNEIIWCYEKPGGPTDRLKNNHSTIFFFGKSQNSLFNTIFVPRKGETELTKHEGRWKTEYEGKISPDWWIDIPSFATMMTAGERTRHSIGIDFLTQQPEKLLQRIIQISSNECDLVMDFFLGSGTTTAVAHKLKRKWIGVEMGEHFYTIVLPRMKKVLAYDKSGISKEKDVKEKYNEKNAGGFFKYFELEQFEQTLRKVKYESDDPFLMPGEDPYNQYIFMRDPKLLDVLEIDYQNKKVKVDLSKLYDNIDIAETLSCVLGKMIKRIKNDEVEFEDGTKISIKDLDYRLLKPLIWW